MKYTTYAENIYRPGETTPPLATAHSEADADAIVSELNRLASERDAAKAQCDKHLTSALAYSLQRDAAVEALIGVQGLAAYMGWNLGDLGVKIAATICATPTPAPSVNAELLAACKKFVDGGECYCHELDANSKPCGVCAAIAAIAKAEKH